ncbi:hypothetical protein DIPPA_17472 [Diplonema papillatum]|nr:hypothetical protein DIPPA_17472 [Diplonema papillatum]
MASLPPDVKKRLLVPPSKSSRVAACCDFGAWAREADAEMWARVSARYPDRRDAGRTPTPPPALPLPKEEYAPPLKRKASHQDLSPASEETPPPLPEQLPAAGNSGLPAPPLLPSYSAPADYQEDPLPAEPAAGESDPPSRKSTPSPPPPERIVLMASATFLEHPKTVYPPRGSNVVQSVSGATMAAPRGRFCGDGRYLGCAVVFEDSDDDEDVIQVINTPGPSASSTVQPPTAAEAGAAQALLSSVTAAYTLTEGRSFTGLDHVLFVPWGPQHLMPLSVSIFAEIDRLETKLLCIPKHVGVHIVSGYKDVRPLLGDPATGRPYNVVTRLFNSQRLFIETPNDLKGKGSVENKMQISIFVAHEKCQPKAGFTVLGSNTEALAELLAQMARKQRSLLVFDYPLLQQHVDGFLHNLKSRLANKSSNRLYSIRT